MSEFMDGGLCAKALLFYHFIFNQRKRVLLEKWIFAQLGRKPPSFYGISMFITSFITTGFLSLFWARWIHYTPSYSALELYCKCIGRCLIFLCSKSCAFDQYLEDFSRYDAEMHAVFQVSVSKSCFTKRILKMMARL